MTNYRVTATTVLTADTSALAKDAFSERIDLDALPCDVMIDACEDGTPSHGENHPCVLTMHALAEAVQALRVDHELVTDLDLGAASDLVERAMHAFSEFYLLFIRQERTIEEQNGKLVRADQSWLRVTDANSALNVALNDRNARIAAASRALEQLLISASIESQRSSVFFTEVRKTREVLAPTIAQASTRTTAPRIAAGSR